MDGNFALLDEFVVLLLLERLVVDGGDQLDGGQVEIVLVFALLVLSLDVELVFHEGDLDLLLLLEAGLVLAGVESDCGAALLKPVDESDLVGGARGLSFSRGGLLADKAQELLVVVGVL